MTEPELLILCAEWQKTLRLQDWTIKLVLVRHYQIPEKVGNVSYNVAKKSAYIQILEASDLNKEGAWEIDQERTLVHELLHLHFAHLKDPDPDSVHEEQAVDALAKALVEMKRRTS